MPLFPLDESRTEDERASDRFWGWMALWFVTMPVLFGFFVWCSTL